MADSKNFAAQFLSKSSSSRSLTDPEPPEPEIEKLEPSPQQMIDALYRVLMERLNEIEKKIDEING